MIKERVLNKFNPKLKQYLFIQVLFSIILLALAFSLTNFDNFLRNLLILLIIFAAPAYGLILLVYNHWTYLIEDNDVTINYGIIFKKSRTISLRSIENVSQKRGPLMDIFGITNVSIWTSAPSQIKITKGNSANTADGVLYLSREEAQELLDYINNFRSRNRELSK